MAPCNVVLCVGRGALLTVATSFQNYRLIDKLRSGPTPIYRGRRVADNLPVICKIIDDVSAHPEGSVQIRVRRRMHRAGVLTSLVAVAVLLGVAPPLAAVVAAIAVIEAGRGLWRTGPLVVRIIEEAAQ